MSDLKKRTEAGTRYTIVKVQWDKYRGNWRITQIGTTGRWVPLPLSRVLHKLKRDAVKHGRKVAKENMPSQLMIHKKDGTSQTEHAYTNDEREALADWLRLDAFVDERAK